MCSQRYIVGALSHQSTEAILSVTAEAVARLRSLAVRGQVDRSGLSVNTGPEIAAARRILNTELQRSSTLPALGDYWRTTLRVTELALELSVPQATWWRHKLEGTSRTPRTAYAHLDESTSALKSIVYLTDVGPENGPTSCYPGVYDALHLHPLQELVGRVIANVGSRAASPLRDYYGRTPVQSMSAASFRAGARADRVRRHFMRLPPELRFNTHFGWDVLPDSALETSLVDAERSVLGSAGTFLIFDGSRLLHRGGMVQGQPRLVLQAMLSGSDHHQSHWPEASRDSTCISTPVSNGREAAPPAVSRPP